MKNFLNILLVGLLLAAPLSAMADNNKKLRKAAAAGDLAMVEQLIQKGADANNSGNKGGGTPLIKAAKNNHIAVAQLLLFHGADPKKKNKKGKSAIDIAERNQHLELAEVLHTSTREQSTSIDTGTALSPEKFKAVVSQAMEKRNWKIEQATDNAIVGRYDRHGIAYKVEAKQGGSIIQLKFLRGYGAKKTGYLENLKKDISAAL